MKPLERQGQVDIWDDTRLLAGTKWKQEIETAIASAKVAVLLVSADFLASSFIAEKEIPPLLVLAKTHGTAILPVIVGACRFTSTPELCDFQAINDPSRPLASLPAAEKERLWVRVADAVVASLADRKPSEGWMVTNERLVLDSLNELVNSPPYSFLIVSSGDCYIQFELHESSLNCEAVANDYLPKRLRLNDAKERQLLSVGFQKPLANLPNYHKTYELIDVPRHLPELAAMVVKTMAEVYEVSQNAKLDVALTVGDCGG